MSQHSFFSTVVRTIQLVTLACLALRAFASDDIRIVTEELPPYNMTVDGRLTGMSTEVVQAVLKEAGVTATIQSMPWARAYDIALNSENVLIYSITRTPQREKLFKWVGDIAPMHWYLFAKSGSNIRLTNLDDARKYQIAAVKEDAGEQYLLSQGFIVGKNLQSSNKYQYNYDKLKFGRVDLWISLELNALHLIRQAGEEPEKVVVRALSLPGLDGAHGLNLAFSQKTPDALVERVRKALETVRKNGTYDAILKKWL